MPSLLPFQRDSVAWLTERRECRRMEVDPTGTGKSHIIAATALECLRQGDRTMVVVHRKELMAQLGARLKEYGIQFGVIASGVKPKDYERCQLAMAQTLRRRMDDRPMESVLIDEGHRSEHTHIHKAKPRRLLMFTATPQHNNHPMTDWVDEMHVGITYTEAIRNGYIVPARIFAPDVPNLGDVKKRGGDYDETSLAEHIMRLGLVGSVVDHWIKLSPGQKTIVFAINVNHAKALADEFAKRGVAVACVSAETPETEREVAMARFRAGSLTVLVNVAVYIEGIDVGDASVVVLARPTHSLPFFLQMAGRGCRAFPGKTHYRIHDHGSNVFEHGSPSQDRQWSLTEGEHVHRGKAAPGIRYCQKCFFCFPPSSTTCPNCATPHTTRPVVSKDGDLVEVMPEKYQPIAGFISAYEKARRQAFAEFGNRPDKFQMVQRRMQETRALMRSGKQIVVPVDPNLLW